MSDNKKKKALFAGSFDPITLAHIDILSKASSVFDDVTIAIAQNPDKKSTFSIEERIEMIKLSTKGFNNVRVDKFDGLSIEYAKQNNIDTLVRGLRNSSDFEYEQQMAHYNQSLCETIKTIFFITKPEYSFISSSGVREILKNNGNISKYVPQPVDEYIKKLN